MLCPELIHHGLSERLLPATLDHHADPLYRVHDVGDGAPRVPPDDASLVLRTEEDVLDHLQRHALRLWHHQEHVDEAPSDNDSEEEEEPRLADARLDVRPGECSTVPISDLNLRLGILIFKLKSKWGFIPHH